MRVGAPVIGLNDSGGARIQEGVVSLAGYADIFLRNTLASGVVPQISAILGPCAGGAVYSPAITDFILMVEDTSYMFVTGPDVIKTVTHEEVTKEELGGAMTHSQRAAWPTFAADDDANACAMIASCSVFCRRITRTIRRVAPPPIPRIARRRARHARSRRTQKPYDMKDVIHAVADDGYFFEVHEHFAQNIVVGFARLGGRSGNRRQPARRPCRRASISTRR